MMTSNGQGGVHHATDEAIDSLYAWIAPAQPAPAPLPEAPASVNVRVLVAGHEVQWTLRGHDEAQVFDRLHTILKRQDVKVIPKPVPKSNWKRNTQGR